MALRAMRWKQLQRLATWRGGQDGHSEILFTLDRLIHGVNWKMKNNSQKTNDESVGRLKYAMQETGGPQ
jgi:hypothetical protein